MQQADLLNALVRNVSPQPFCRSQVPVRSHAPGCVAGSPCPAAARVSSSLGLLAPGILQSWVEVQPGAGSCGAQEVEGSSSLKLSVRLSQCRVCRCGQAVCDLMLRWVSKAACGFKRPACPGKSHPLLTSVTPLVTEIWPTKAIDGTCGIS